LRQSIEVRLGTAERAINGALRDAELAAILVQWGIATERLQQGQQLRQHAMELCQRQHTSYATLAAASNAHEAALRAARTIHGDHVGVARLAFKRNPGMQQKLDIRGTQKDSNDGWLGQARQFYAVALADQFVQQQLAEYGLTQEKLALGSQQVELVSARKTEWQHYKGEAQEATKLRDEALKELDVWLRYFCTIARMAFQRQPGALAKLGLVARAS
jgi:hypothetical protein